MENNGWGFNGKKDKIMIIPDNVYGCGVYLITNTKTGNRYVGSSKNVRSRISQHRSSLIYGRANHKMKADFETHGENSFTVKMLRQYKFDKLWNEVKEKELEYLEKYYINKIKPEYNTGNPSRNTMKSGRKKIFNEDEKIVVVKSYVKTKNLEPAKKDIDELIIKKKYA